MFFFFFFLERWGPASSRARQERVGCVGIPQLEQEVSAAARTPAFSWIRNVLLVGGRVKLELFPSHGRGRSCCSWDL